MPFYTFYFRMVMPELDGRGKVEGDERSLLPPWYPLPRAQFSLNELILLLSQDIFCFCP